MNEIKSVLATAVVRLLIPLMRVLMRYEISHSEFSELAKRAYVRAAYRYYTLPNRKVTYSRVSVLTGLNRKEVVRISELPADEPPKTKGPVNRARRVIHGWVNDPAFLDPDGLPKTLPLRDESPCFEELVARYSGDLSGRAVLDELVRVGSVEKIDKQHIRLVHRAFIPDESDAESINILTQHTTDLLRTGVHNLYNEDQKQFQRQLTYHEIPESVEQEFQEFSRQRSMDLLIEFDRWLAEKKQTHQSENDVKRRVGVGIYYFQNKDDEG